MSTVRTASRPDVVALVPLRTGGKSRLAAELPDERRDALVLAMLDDVLGALRGAGIDDVRILAGNPAAVAAATARDLHPLPDPASSEPATQPWTLLRRAVDAGLAAVRPVRTRLIVAADLPRLTAAEVAAVIAAPSDVAVAPTAGGGTGLLRLAPGVVVAARYGPGSAGAHLVEAERSGHSAELVDLPGARYDVDAVGDLAALGHALEGSVAGSATTTFLTSVRG